MKPFDLEKALAGEPVVTRDGKKVIDLYHFKLSTGEFPLVVNIEGKKALSTYTTRGKLTNAATDHEYDLLMAPPETWVNVYYNKTTGVYGSSIGTTYPSEQMAKAGITDLENGEYQTTIKINP
jgi:hypothetical protein